MIVFLEAKLNQMAYSLSRRLKDPGTVGPAGVPRFSLSSQGLGNRLGSSAFQHTGTVASLQGVLSPHAHLACNGAPVRSSGVANAQKNMLSTSSTGGADSNLVSSKLRHHASHTVSRSLLFSQTWSTTYFKRPLFHGACAPWNTAEMPSKWIF